MTPTQDDLDALQHLRNKLFASLGHCIDKYQTQSIAQKLVDAPITERASIVLAYWGSGHLDRIDPILQQLAVLETRLTS